MPLKRYADFSGRSRRMEYWMWVLFQILLYVGVMVLAVGLVAGGAAAGDGGGALAAGGAGMVLMGLYFLAWLAFLVPSIAVGVRRLHDTNRTGWWLLAPVLPSLLLIFAAGASLASPENMAASGGLAMVAMLLVFVLSIVLLVFMLLDGTPGPNKYGPDPKGRGQSEVFA